jgi:hypothetical protein
MKGEAKQTECATHGKGFETFVCEHLIFNPAQECFLEKPNVTKRWPDAWCASCDVLYQQEGEWNDENNSNIKIKLLRHHCYERLRSQEKSSLGGN